MRQNSRAGAAVLAILAGVAGQQARAQTSTQMRTQMSTQMSTPAPMSPAVCTAHRPSIGFNRWSENWGQLADPCVVRQPGDDLKYIALGDSGSYLSLGAGLRERFEMSNTAAFGAGAAGPDNYLIQRANLHADLRLGEYVQVFGQLVDARAYHKDTLGSPDHDILDVEQFFAAVVVPHADGFFKARIGRQEMAFDLQRFIAARDGPNVRQSFDGLWADWEDGPWRWIGFATHPVQNRSMETFDDLSNRQMVLNGLRVERQGLGPGDAVLYYSRYRRDGARFPDASGDERRDVCDARYSGKRGNLDWDAEGMLQRGSVGQKRIQAWALGSIAGYTFAAQPWTPRLGLQFDAASGDRHAGDNTIGTFNPLFPNGYYFSLAGLTGYNNLVHLKPSLTLKPVKALSVMGALGLQWRATVADAVYAQGSAAVPRTAGAGSRWTGAYVQLRADWSIDPNLTAAVEAVHFQVGPSLRAAGGSNADYLGVELKFGW